MTKQTRWIVIAIAAAVVGIFFFIVAKWLLLILVGALIFGWIIFATESAKAQTAPVRPPTPVYTPPVQPATAEQPAPYAQGYQAQAPSSAPGASFPFTPPSTSSGAEPQPHQDRPGQVYEDPLVQYPE